MRPVYPYVLLVSHFWICLNASAGEGLSREEWNPVSLGPITTWTAPLCGKGKFVVQPFAFYNRTRGSFDHDGHYDSLATGDKKYQLQQQLFVQYGITDCLEIDAQTVYQESYVKQGDQKAHSNGFGDSYLFLRYCFFEEKWWIPHVTGHFQLKVPTGKYQHADPGKLGADLMGATSGGGSWDPGFAINLSKKLKPFYFHTDMQYSFPQKVRVDGIRVKYANYLSYDLGVECFLPRGLNVIVETNGFDQGDKKEDGKRTHDSNICYLMGAAGIGWSCEKLQMLLSYQRVVVGTNTDANDSAVLSCVYTF